MSKWILFMSKILIIIRKEIYFEDTLQLFDAHPSIIE